MRYATATDQLVKQVFTRAARTEQQPNPIYRIFIDQMSRKRFITIRASHSIIHLSTAVLSVSRRSG